MLSSQKLVKKYRSGDAELTVLKEIDLEFKTGEFASIIGPSGAGKSTFLYQLSLLDSPTSGEIFFDGLATTTLSEARKTSLRLQKMGFVFQDYALLPELTALENVALPILMQGASKREAESKAVIALTKVGLAERKNNLPSQLSGGQQQRVSIARAVAHDPQVLFADEPTANLDSASSRLVMEAFLDLHKEGQTIIMVTHEMEYAELAKRIVELKDGIVVNDRRA
jgi:putative ABC transport system ATP-binding protein